MSPSEIWIADDDADDIILYQYALRDLGNELPVVFFRNGCELVNTLVARDAEFQCYLIIDNRMPVLDGIGVIRELALRDVLKSHLVTVISTRAMPDQEKYVKSLGLLFFEKPAQYHALVDMFRAILLRRQ